jgi:hypothetical protein
VSLQPLQQSLTSTPGPSAEDEYVGTVRLLNRHFAAEVNTPYERYKLRQMHQGESETIDEYVTRVCQQIQNTGWTCRQADEAVRDQIVARCFSSSLGSKPLMEAANITLLLALEIAHTWELTNAQSEQMSGHVNALCQNPHKNPPHSISPKGNCYRCGEPRHYGNSDKCPAKEAGYKKCGIVGHYVACCKTTPSRVKWEKFNKKKHKKCQEGGW